MLTEPHSQQQPCLRGGRQAPAPPLVALRFFELHLCLEEAEGPRILTRKEPFPVPERLITQRHKFALQTFTVLRRR